ncbi:hypothetical protein SAMN05443287_10728 [Micromonospora phaseoli]|uniref:Uncharacterized protein n=1 Tax=Micromonospora phaseoli TaxID=1144548 RepID=A0A1H7B9Q2_9ACTN|nr:hypothetical protein CLV64_108334 [Micromonospora phaseoli]SEJ72997.1 hypothetical protein SAMN05443287_10728 [Micromonospora phaseoli]
MRLVGGLLFESAANLMIKRVEGGGMGVEGGGGQTRATAKTDWPNGGRTTCSAALVAGRTSVS